MSQNPETQPAAWFRIARSLLVALTSPQATVFLLLSLAAIIATAMSAETAVGPEWSRWFVYDSFWFLILLLLIAMHLVCAVAFRIPWKLSNIGGLTLHAGLLIIIGGQVHSHFRGSVGCVTIAENQSADEMVLTGNGQVTAFWVGRPQERSFEFPFDGGPVDWSAGQSLHLGEVDGIRARVLGYYRHAQFDETWVADATHRGGPAVRFRACGANGKSIAEGWLVDQQFGDAVAIGPIRLDLQQAASDRMLEDFLRPPAGIGEKGLLLAYLGDEVECVSLDTYAGGVIPLGSSGVAVEIVQFLPNARPDARGNFSSRDDLPRNPMVELRVHLPGHKQPLRQIAFAKDPLLNLDGVYPITCPVKFRFEHPAVQRQTTVELLQTRDGRLFGRLCSSGRYESPCELRRGSRIDLPGICGVEIIQHLPHARRTVTFSPGTDSARQRSGPSEPAALVEVTERGKAEQVWLRRGDAIDGRAIIDMPGGAMALAYEPTRMPLGFTLALASLPSGVRADEPHAAAAIDQARVVLHDHGRRQEREITHRLPLRLGDVTISLSTIEDSGHGLREARFVVTRDPGRMAKLAGGVTAGAGLILSCVVWMIAAIGQRAPRLAENSSDNQEPRDQGHTTARRLAA